MSEDSFPLAFPAASDRPRMTRTLRYGRWLCAAVFLAMLIGGINLIQARSQRLAWIEANAVVVDGQVVDEVHVPGEGYREVVEYPRAPGEAPGRIIGDKVWPRSLLERRRGVTEPVRYWPEDPSIPPQITRIPQGPLPLFLDLILRPLALVMVASGFFALRRAALLAREGIRLRGTVFEYRQRRAKSRIYHIPVIHIEEAPHAGQLFESASASFAMDRYPPGSSVPVLAHPTREVFELEQPGHEKNVLLMALGFALAIFFLPDLAVWIFE